jgi:hypothetical protein
MKLYLNDLIKHNWLKQILVNAKSQLLQVGAGKILVFYYYYNEGNSSLYIDKEEIRYVINEDIYRTLARANALHVGFLQEPFESNNYILYAYLMRMLLNGTTTDEDFFGARKKLTNLFIEYKDKDIELAKSKSVGYIKGIFDINSKFSCLEALDEIFYINKKAISGFRVIFDMFDEYYKRTKNVSFYGKVLSSFVRLVKNPNGGIINQENGTIRYLIIGEKAGGSDPKLKDAKEQLRQGLDTNTIYLNTGWYFNKYDSKWRKRIDDSEFSFKQSNIVHSDNNVFSILTDKGYSGDESGLRYDITEFSNNKVSLSYLIKNNYTNKVNDLVEHSQVFKLYPSLKDVFVLYLKDITLRGNRFYYSKNAPKHIALLSKNVLETKIPYIALHEIQHFIQNYEGFSNGGNTHLANIINSSGGASTREFLNLINSLIKRVNEVNKTIDLQVLSDDLNSLGRGSSEISWINIINYLLDYAKDRDILINASDIFALMLLQSYSLTKNNKGSIKRFISKHYGDNYIMVFDENLKKAEGILQKNESLIAKGWTPNDITALNFQTYEAILGEVESRFVQETVHIDRDLSDYFAFYTSESILPENITVIAEIPPLNVPKEIKAAIEYANGHYIIHLPDEYSNSVNILHELGHIVFDILVETKDILNDESKYEDEVKKAGYESFEEYVCDSFVDFIQRMKIDEGLTEDLNDERKVRNYDSFDYYFKSILLENELVIDENGLKNRLTFINYVNSL